jgi:hypothetical protein
VKRACACAYSYDMWGCAVVGVAEGRKALHSRMLELRAVNEDLHMMTRENQVANGASITRTETCQPGYQQSDLVRLLSLTCVMCCGGGGCGGQANWRPSCGRGRDCSPR